MLLAARGIPDLRVVVWIVLASVFARTAAMCFNRWTDAQIDARNPRTATRAIPAGQISRLCRVGNGAGGGGFICIFCCNAELPGLCALAARAVCPAGLLVLQTLHQPFHFVLGLALGIAPVGAWVAVRGKIELTPLLLCVAVLVWTAGFDLIYRARMLRWIANRNFSQFRRCTVQPRPSCWLGCFMHCAWLRS